jgi:hypothetical protein
MKITQIDAKQRDHDAAINRAAFALGKPAHEVRSRIRWEMDRKKLGTSEIGRWYVKELNKLGMTS